MGAGGSTGGRGGSTVACGQFSGAGGGGGGGGGGDEAPGSPRIRPDRGVATVGRSTGAAGCRSGVTVRRGVPGDSRAASGGSGSVPVGAAGSTGTSVPDTASCSGWTTPARWATNPPSAAARHPAATVPITRAFVVIAAITGASPVPSALVENSGLGRCAGSRKGDRQRPSEAPVYRLDHRHAARFAASARHTGWSGLCTPGWKSDPGFRKETRCD